MKLTEEQIDELVMRGISNADDASELILQMVRDITGEDDWMVSDDILLPLLRKLIRQYFKGFTRSFVLDIDVSIKRL